MATQPYVVDRFLGLDLRDDPQEAGPTAADLLNVDLGNSGRIRNRPGMTSIGDAQSGGYTGIFASATNGGEFLGVRQNSTNTLLDSVSMGGSTTVVGTRATTATTYPVSFAALGTATSSLVYFTLYDYGTPAGLTIAKYNGSTLATGTGKPQFVVTWPRSNRLVQGSYLAAADGPTGANGNLSAVFFSDPGAPDTYGANNWVHLRPGDGEQITAMVSWQESLYVFKQTSVFIFDGEEIDNDGEPIFDFRRVDLPEPLVAPNLRYSPYAVSAPDGVYFSTMGGIYRLAYGGPELVTSAITPLFRGDTNVSSSVRFNGNAPPILSVAAGRLFATYSTAAGAVRALVLDFATGQWSLWTVPGGQVYVPFPALSGGNAALYVVPRDLFAATLTTTLGYMSPNVSTDSGASISWSYTSNPYDMGQAGQVKITLESKLVGWGSATLQVATQDASSSSAGAFDTGSSVTMGTAPLAAEGWQQIDREGGLFQHKLSGTGAVNVQRLVHYLSFVKPVGVV